MAAAIQMKFTVSVGQIYLEKCFWPIIPCWRGLRFRKSISRQALPAEGGGNLFPDQITKRFVVLEVVDAVQHELEGRQSQSRFQVIPEGQMGVGREFLQNQRVF